MTIEYFLAWKTIFDKERLEKKGIKALTGKEKMTGISLSYFIYNTGTVSTVFFNLAAEIPKKSEEVERLIDWNNWLFIFARVKIGP